MRQDITFTSEGILCAGWFYVPAARAAGERFPAIVMAHGFGGLKEGFLDDYAERFCAAGFAVTVFDYRFFGGSAGQPRDQVLPLEQQRDYRNAISWTQGRPEVDPERIGLWGSSMSAGHVFCLASLDRRVKAVVGQVPFISGYQNMRRIIPDEAVAGLQAQLAADRVARYAGAAPKMFPIFARDGQPGLFGTPDALQFWDATSQRAPTPALVTLESLEATMFYEPATHIEAVSPTPLMMIVAKHDVLCPTDVALAAYERVRQPKELVMIDGGHFDAYTGENFRQSSQPAVAWFTKHLRGGQGRS